MTPSPIEARALAHVAGLPHLTRLMNAQHARGRSEYGHPIDLWVAFSSEAKEEAAREVADALTYLEYAGDVPPEVFTHLRAVAEWLDSRVPYIRSNIQLLKVAPGPRRGR